jgi:maleamate amidohydrolase
MKADGQELGAVDALLAFYGERGYEFRVGPGVRPAILVVDFSLAFTRGRGDFPGGEFAPELAATRRLLDSARAKSVPIAYTTIAYAPHMRDAGLWAVKVPWLAHCREGSDAVRIDPRLDPREDETVLVKKFPSAFFDTSLDAMLKAWCTDTLILAGCTTSVCVRATALDAMQHGYRTLVAADAVGDFNAALHAVHLADIGSRYADVMSVEQVLLYFDTLGATSTV